MRIYIKITVCIWKRHLKYAVTSYGTKLDSFSTQLILNYLPATLLV